MDHIKSSSVQFSTSMQSFLILLETEGLQQQQQQQQSILIIFESNRNDDRNRVISNQFLPISKIDK